MSDAIEETPPVPPDTPPPAPVPASEPGQSTTQKIDVKDWRVGRDAQVINEQHNDNRSFFGDVAVDDAVLQTAFSAANGEPLPQEESDELSRTLACDETVIARLLRHLDDRRVLLLTGDRETGKRSIAVYLGVKLREEKSLGNPPLVVNSLERRMRIRLHEVAANKNGFGNRVTVFVDAFEQKNQQLRGFFSTADGLDWHGITTMLKANAAYLIFTGSTESTPFRAHAREHIAHYELAPLRDDLVLRGLDERLAWMATRSDVSAGRLADLAEHRARIIGELKTLPRIVSFVKQFVRDEEKLEDALRQFRDVSYWFRTTLDRDADSWSFVLTLALAQPGLDPKGAPWSDFERLRRAVAERIRSDVDAFPRRRRRDSDEFDDRAGFLSFCDDDLLWRCRAEVVKDANRLGDIIRFEHPSFTNEVWQTLLTHHRRALLALLPVLRNIAEQNRDMVDWSLRGVAAQAIGRIGEIDPARITTPLLYEWTGARPEAQRPLGKLVQGAMASGNEHYQSLVLWHLELLTANSLQGDPEARERLLTMIGAFAQIGLDDLDIAMKRIGIIVTEYLTPVFENVHQLGRAADSVSSQLSNARSRRAASGLRARRFEFRAVADGLLAEHAPALVAVKQAVIQLCLQTEPVKVLRAMRDWISKGGTPTGTLVAMLLFLPDGIAANLNALPPELGEATSRVRGPLLLALAANKDAVHTFCGFLADVHASISSTFLLPASLQNDFKERFDALLTTLARDGVAIAEHRKTAENLFVALAKARGGSVHGDITTLLESPAFAESSAMREFADTVGKRIGPSRK